MKKIFYGNFSLGEVLLAGYARVFALRAFVSTHRLLAENRIGVIHFEFNEMNEGSGCFMRDFRTVLAGYRFFRLLPNALLELSREPVLSEIFGFQNIIAIREDHEWLRYRGI